MACDWVDIPWSPCVIQFLTVEDLLTLSSVSVGILNAITQNPFPWIFAVRFSVLTSAAFTLNSTYKQQEHLQDLKLVANKDAKSDCACSEGRSTIIYHPPTHRIPPSSPSSSYNLDDRTLIWSVLDICQSQSKFPDSEGQLDSPFSDEVHLPPLISGSSWPALPFTANSANTQKVSIDIERPDTLHTQTRTRARRTLAIMIAAVISAARTLQLYSERCHFDDYLLKDLTMAAGLGYVATGKGYVFAALLGLLKDRELPSYGHERALLDQFCKQIFPGWRRTCVIWYVGNTVVASLARDDKSRHALLPLTTHETILRDSETNLNLEEQDILHLLGGICDEHSEARLDQYAVVAAWRLLLLICAKYDTVDLSAWHSAWTETFGSNSLMSITSSEVLHESLVRYERLWQEASSCAARNKSSPDEAEVEDEELENEDMDTTLFLPFTSVTGPHSSPGSEGGGAYVLLLGTRRGTVWVNNQQGQLHTEGKLLWDFLANECAIGRIPGLKYPYSAFVAM